MKNRFRRLRPQTTQTSTIKIKPNLQSRTLAPMNLASPHMRMPGACTHQPSWSKTQQDTMCMLRLLHKIKVRLRGTFGTSLRVSCPHRTSLHSLLCIFHFSLPGRSIPISREISTRTPMSEPKLSYATIQQKGQSLRHYQYHFKYD